jgi:hypothetical protein
MPHWMVIIMNELHIPYYYHDDHGYLYLVRGSWCRFVRREHGAELEPVLDQHDAQARYDKIKTRTG